MKKNELAWRVLIFNHLLSRCDNHHCCTFSAHALRVEIETNGLCKRPTEFGFTTIKHERKSWTGWREMLVLSSSSRRHTASTLVILLILCLRGSGVTCNRKPPPPCSAMFSAWSCYSCRHRVVATGRAASASSMALSCSFVAPRSYSTTSEKRSDVFTHVNSQRIEFLSAEWVSIIFNCRVESKLDSSEEYHRARYIKSKIIMTNI